MATVPKTIDNDLPLPENAPTFGFETARAVGTGIVETLMEDARTTERWYLAMSMGRKSGALALGMCKAAGATLAVIPGSSERRGSTSTWSSTRSSARSSSAWLRAGTRRGLIAEGIAGASDAEKDAQPQGTERDAYGHVRLADVAVGAVLRDMIRSTARRDRRRHRPWSTKTLATNFAAPSRFRSTSSTRARSGSARCAICSRRQRRADRAFRRPVTPVTLDDLRDPSNWPRTRADGRRDDRSLSGRPLLHDPARGWDLEEPSLSHLASVTKLSAQAFRDRFRPAVSATVSLPDLSAPSDGAELSSRRSRKPRRGSARAIALI